MTGPLQGYTVVVTRPEHQASRFIDLARAAGAATIALPALTVRFLEPDAATGATLLPDDYDWVLYTSANAVEAALAYLPAPRRAHVAAVGAATARALRARGIAVDAVPVGRSDSEGLLALPSLACPAGLRVLILRGVGGRELLRGELLRRGATVVVGELYRREPATADAVKLERLADSLKRPRSTVVAVTSVEVLDGLLGLADAALAERLRAALLLLPGERVAAAARDRRWAGEIIVASSAEDGAMLAALEQYAASRGAPSLA
ncbi:MAG TPA: uroporphyrinogen-III synthase [Steroidobacteraceae bacterium]|nr:uroporphyrinogen-III synthase [Steroidobacteraceae bacterium]